MKTETRPVGADNLHGTYDAQFLHAYGVEPTYIDDVAYQKRMHEQDLSCSCRCEEVLAWQKSVLTGVVAVAALYLVIRAGIAVAEWVGRTF